MTRAGLGDQLLHVLGTVEEAIVVLRRDWTCAYANAATLALLQLDAMPRDVDIRVLYPAAVRSPLGEAFARVLAGGAAEVVEEHDAAQDTYLRARILPLPDGLVVVLRDVTAERRPEVALARDHGRYQQVIDHAHSALALRDLDSRFLLVNRFGAELIGRSSEEIVGRTLHDVFDEDVAAALRAADLEVQRSGRAQERMSLVLDQGTKGRRLLAQVYPVHGEDGRVIAVGTVATDVTQLNEAEDRLAAAHRRYKQLFGSTSLGILLVRTGGLVVEANAAACQMLGYSRAQLLALSAPELVLKTPEEMVARRSQVLSEGKLGFEAEDLFIRSDGRLLPVLVTMNVLEDLDGGGELFSLLMRDLSGMKELQDRVLKSERLEATGRLAAGIAHDSNNILASIHGYTEMLTEEVAGSPAALRHIAGIHRSIDRAGEMVSQLLAFTRGLHLSAVRIDLRDVVLDLEDMLRRLLPASCVLTVQADPAPTFADATQVRQVVLNLLVNANEALSGSGSISLTTSVQEVAGDPLLPAGSYATLTVTDDGPGMDEAAAGRCFEPFFTTRLTEGGTGLGLSTAHGIARQSGGDLRLRTAPGEGASFQLLLPASGSATQPLPPVEELAAATAAAAHAPALVLVVDDDADCRRVVADALRACDYDVVEASGGRAALRAGFVPDLLVTDVNMPDIDGFQLADALRRDRPELLVLYISGAAAPGSGSDQLLRKPFTIATLLGAVAGVLADGRG